MLGAAEGVTGAIAGPGLSTPHVSLPLTPSRAPGSRSEGLSEHRVTQGPKSGCSRQA